MIQIAENDWDNYAFKKKTTNVGSYPFLSKDWDISISNTKPPHYYNKITGETSWYRNGKSWVQKYKDEYVMWYIAIINKGPMEPGPQMEKEWNAAVQSLRQERGRLNPDNDSDVVMKIMDLRIEHGLKIVEALHNLNTKGEETTKGKFPDLDIQSLKDINADIEKALSVKPNNPIAAEKAAEKAAENVVARVQKSWQEIRAETSLEERGIHVTPEMLRKEIERLRVWDEDAEERKHRERQEAAAYAKQSAQRAQELPNPFAAASAPYTGYYDKH